VRFVTGASFGQACQFLSGAVDLSSNVERVSRPEREVQDFTERFEAEFGNRLGWIEEARRLWPHLTFEWLECWFKVKPTKHALWIPHFDGARMTGVKTRSFYTGQKKAFEGSTYPNLYRRRGTLRVSTGWRQAAPARAQGTELWLCEGESDTWTMTRFADAEVVDVAGLPSGVQGWQKHLEEIQNYDRVTLWFDHDRAGVNAGHALGQALAATEKPVVWRGQFPEEFNDVTEAAVGGWRPTV
jgi:hypothetical protein